MPIVSYGWRGQPVLLFPTAAADFLENERFWLVKAIEPLLQQGRIRVFSIDSINRLAWMDRGLPVRESARRQALYSRYVEDEVVPFIRHICGDGGARAITTGASFGCFHAANAFFRRPDLFGGVIGMSGFYDLAPSYFKGYSDDNCYLLDRKGVGHIFDLWGHDVNHDWPWWRKMLPHYLERVGC